MLHCDLKGRPYRIEDFRQELRRIAVLSDIASLGAYQMNHVWLATLRTPEAKERLVSAKELNIKNLRCVVIDPCSTEVRLRVHWVPFHVHDDTVSKLFEPYGKVLEVTREKWRVEGFEAIESTTRIVRITLKSGVTPDGMPHQLRLQGGNVLIVIPGRPPVCLRCKRAGHIRRDCRVPKCSVCFRFGHDREDCVRTYARVTGGDAKDDLPPLTMEVNEAELVLQGLEQGSKPTTQPQGNPNSDGGPAKVSLADDEDESAPGIPEQGSEILSLVATPTAVGAVSPAAYPPMSEKGLPEGVVVMDEATDSPKRDLEDTPPSPSMALNDNPWLGMEKNKRGRFKTVPYSRPDDRPRVDSS